MLEIDADSINDLFNTNIEELNEENEFYRKQIKHYYKEISNDKILYAIAHFELEPLYYSIIEIENKGKINLIRKNLLFRCHLDDILKVLNKYDKVII